MNTLTDYAGKILEELEEVETIDCKTTDGLFTLTAACGGAYTLYCC